MAQENIRNVDGARGRERYRICSSTPRGASCPPYNARFGLFDWPNLPFFAGQTREQLHPVHEAFGTAHVLLAWLSIALIPIHVGGALYHQFIEKDDVMRRMLPGTKVGA